MGNKCCKGEIMKKLDRIVILFLLAICAFGSILHYYCKESEIIIIEKKVPMSVRDLQEFLNEQGHSRYECEVDGVFGRETNQALENYLCDQYAKREFVLTNN